MTKLRDQLEAAQAEPSVVRATRGSFDTEGELGYVVAVGVDLILLLRISNEIRFEGFVVLRIADITALEAPHAHSHFVEEALRRRGESVASAPAVDLASVSSAVRTAGNLFPIVAIHREEADPEVCHVGAVVKAGLETVSLLEIDPDAEWEEEPTLYAVSEVTRVEFGGGYEEALALVGGTPPSIPHLKPVP